jgi:hypothetical protein
MHAVVEVERAVELARQNAKVAEQTPTNSARDEICAFTGRDCGYMRVNGVCLGPECSLHPSHKHSPVA